MQKETPSEYNLVPRALRANEARKIFYQISSHKSAEENCKLWYQLALKVYDTEDFNPFEVLPSCRMKDEPSDLLNPSTTKSQAACYYGYVDPKYSPENSKRVFKLNINCFDEVSPIIAVRGDASTYGYGRMMGK